MLGKEPHRGEHEVRKKKENSGRERTIMLKMEEGGATCAETRISDNTRKEHYTYCKEERKGGE